MAFKNVFATSLAVFTNLGVMALRIKSGPNSYGQGKAVMQIFTGSPEEEHPTEFTAYSDGPGPTDLHSLLITSPTTKHSGFRSQLQLFGSTTVTASTAYLSGTYVGLLGNSGRIGQASPGMFNWNTATVDVGNGVTQVYIKGDKGAIGNAGTEQMTWDRVGKNIDLGSSQVGAVIQMHDDVTIDDTLVVGGRVVSSNLPANVGSTQIPSVPAGYAAGGAFYSRVNGWVMVRFNQVQTTGAAHVAATVIGILPVGFRPLAQVLTVAYINSGVFGRLIINTDGSIQYTPIPGVWGTTQNMQGNAAFPAV